MAPESEGTHSKRVAILLPDLRGGGAETLRVRLAAAFARRGVGVEFWLANATGDLLEEVAKRYPVIDLEARRIRSLYRPLIKCWEHRAPDAVIADMWPNTVVAAACWRKLSKTQSSGRLALCDHNTLSLKPECQGVLRSQLLSKSIRIAYPWADIRIAVSAGVADDLAATSGLGRDQFHVIHNPGFGKLETFELPDPWPTTGLRLLCVGSLKQQKGFSLAIRALAALNDPTTSLAIVGEGPLRSELESLAIQLGVANQVVLPGFTKDVHPWYAHADVFCLTSNWEGFGIVLVEALQHGLQIVSTNCQSGPSEILEKGKYGELVPVGDDVAFAKAIERVRQNPIPPSLLKRRAEDFDIEAITDQYLNILVPL